MIIDPTYKDVSLLEISEYNSPLNQGNPIKISRISQKKAEIEKLQKKGCC